MRSITIGSGSLSVTLLDFGARIARIKFQNKDLALSYRDYVAFLEDSFYLGATIGPISNRILNGEFYVHDKLCSLPKNEGRNSLHSGELGFDRQYWSVDQISSDKVCFKLITDLHEFGLQGELTTYATYSVMNNQLHIDYVNFSNIDAFINTTNHVYLNLSGNCFNGDNKPIDDHEFVLHGENTVVYDEHNLPNGTLKELTSAVHYQMGAQSNITEFSDGVDHHFNVMSQNDTDLKTLVEAKSKTTGVQLKVKSTSPGYQFYTATHLDRPFSHSGGFCVEAQYAPDAINQGTFFSPLLKANEQRSQKIMFEFTMKKAHPR